MPISGDILGPGILFGLGALVLSSFLVFLQPQTFDGPGNTSAGTLLFLTYTLSSVLAVSTHALDQSNLLFSTALANVVLSLLAISVLSRVHPRVRHTNAGGKKLRNVVILEMILIGLGVIGSTYSQIYETVRAGRSVEGTLNGVLVGLQALLGACITSPYMLGTRECIATTVADTSTVFLRPLLHPVTGDGTRTAHTITDAHSPLNNTHHARPHDVPTSASMSTITATTPESPTAPSPSPSRKQRHFKRAQLRRRLITVPLAALTVLASVGVMLYAKIGLGIDVDGDREGWSVKQMFAAAPGFMGLYSTVVQGMYTIAEDEEVEAVLEKESGRNNDTNEDERESFGHDPVDGENDITVTA